MHGGAGTEESGDQRPALTHCPMCRAPLHLDEGDRSWQQLKRFHAEIRAWYNHWPDKDRWGFYDVENFRKRLQMAAGHRKLSAKVSTINPETGEVLDGEFLARILRAAFIAAGSYAQAEVDGSDILIYKPRSVALHRMNSAAFSEMYDRCRLIFETETGLNPDEVFKED